MFPSPRNSLRSLYALLFIILLSSIGGCDLKNKQRDAFAESGTSYSYHAYHDGHAVRR